MNTIIPARASRPVAGLVNVEDMRQSWQYGPLRKLGIWVEATRMPHAEGTVVDADHMRHFADSVALTNTTRTLLSARPSAVGFACASASFVDGPAGDEKIRRTMAGALGLEIGQAVTTTSAFVSGCFALEADQVDVASVYTERMTKPLPHYLRQFDIETVNTVCAGLESGIPDFNRSQRRELIRAVAQKGRVILVPCTNLTWEEGETAALEREFGVVIIVANEVTMWAIAHLMGVATSHLMGVIHRPGELFKREFPGNPAVPE